MAPEVYHVMLGFGKCFFAEYALGNARFGIGMH